MLRHLDVMGTAAAGLGDIELLLRTDPGALLVDARPLPAHEAEPGARAFATTFTIDTTSGVAVGHEVEVEVGPLTVDEGVVAVEVSWRPSAHERLLPIFDGLLSARAAGDAQTVLRLEGDYIVPLGAVGRFGDAVLGSRLARRTAQSLIRRLIERITRMSPT